jgi:hypothetical protein
MTDVAKFNAVGKSIQIRTYGPDEIAHGRVPKATWQVSQDDECSATIGDGIRWLKVLCDGLRHVTYLMQVSADGRTIATLPLALVKSPFFGRFLVSLPYVNSAGIHAETTAAACQLVESAVALADQLDVRYLELRQEQELTHPALTHKNESKVLMPAAATTEHLWTASTKLRSQIRSAENTNSPFASERRTAWTISIRSSAAICDLGTPVYSRNFSRRSSHFPGRQSCVSSG